MGNHGSVTFSHDLVDAYYKLEILDAYCRILLLTKQLGRPVLASAAFAGHVDIGWSDLGRHELRGVADAQPVFAPAGPDACQP